MIKILDRLVELVTMISRTAKSGGVIERMNIKVTGNVEEMHNSRDLLAQSLESFRMSRLTVDRMRNEITRRNRK